MKLKKKKSFRWPGLLSRYPRHEHHEWREEFRRRADVGRAVGTKVAGMSPLYIHKEEVPKAGFADLGNTDNPQIARFIIDALMEIYHDKDRY